MHKGPHGSWDIHILRKSYISVGKEWGKNAATQRNERKRIMNSIDIVRCDVLIKATNKGGAAHVRDNPVDGSILRRRSFIISYKRSLSLSLSWNDTSVKISSLMTTGLKLNLKADSVVSKNI